MQQLLPMSPALTRMFDDESRTCKPPVVTHTGTSSTKSFLSQMFMYSLLNNSWLIAIRGSLYDGENIMKSREAKW